MDAFSQDCSSDNNWLVPPIAVIGKVLNHIGDCRAVGTLIVPSGNQRISGLYYATMVFI